MTSAALERPAATGALDPDRLRAILLVRVAGAADGLTVAGLADELAPLAVHRLTPVQWRTLAAREIEALVGAGLIEGAPGGRVIATPAGVARAAIFVGAKGNLPRSWPHLHEVRLIAKALGLEREPAKRLAALATPDGLRAAIVQRAFGLKIKGTATPSRLRGALAATALERAFGNQIKAGLTGKLGLSAKAGRLLAAQLARKPRDFGTDARLVAALAAEQVGAARADLASLRLAVLRRYLDGEARADSPARPPAKVAPLRPRVVATPPPQPVPAQPSARPGLAGFAEEVRRHASACAEGWPGNRKAYISHVWHALRQRRSDWGLSEIEFKCMLAEAHRAGSLALAHADLKDNSNIRELQDSAVVYKNAVFHFVRVDG